MKLYHGSNFEVKNPGILTTLRTGDFGRGFYTTSSIKQARRWAQIRARQAEIDIGIVSIFEVDDTIFENHLLSVKTFTTANDEWLDFVLANRMDVAYEHQFDLVRGPVANDRVYACLNALEEGLAERATVLKRLKTFVLADQILFHTSQSLQFLSFAAIEEVPC